MTWLYHKLAIIEEKTKMLKQAFPKLLINTVLNKPYTHVTIRACQMPNLAPLESLAVLDTGDLSYPPEIEFEEPVEEYPTNHLVAQLALIA